MVFLLCTNFAIVGLFIRSSKQAKKSRQKTIVSVVDKITFHACFPLWKAQAINKMYVRLLLLLFFGKCTLFSTCFYGKMMLFVLIGFNHVAVIGGAWNESFSLSLHHHCDVWYCLFCLRQRCDMDAGHETQYMFINLTRFKTWNHWIRIILTLASDLLLILELRM